MNRNVNCINIFKFDYFWWITKIFKSVIMITYIYSKYSFQKWSDKTDVNER